MCGIKAADAVGEDIVIGVSGCSSVDGTNGVFVEANADASYSKFGGAANIVGDGDAEREAAAIES